MPRLFLGVAPDSSLIARLTEAQRRFELSPTFQPHLRACRFMREAQLHLTLHFLGEWDEERLPELSSELRKIHAKATRQRLDEVLFFPKRPHATVGGLGSQLVSPPLATLYKDLGDALARLGIAVEERRFTPHITLFRFKFPQPIREVPLDLEPLEMAIDHFHLYKSTPTPEGSRYQVVEEVRFPVAETPNR